MTQPVVPKGDEQCTRAAAIQRGLQTVGFSDSDISGETWHVVFDQNVAIRAEPSLTGKVVGAKKPGARVLVAYRSGDWVRLHVDEGYPESSWMLITGAAKGLGPLLARGEAVPAPRAGPGDELLDVDPAGKLRGRCLRCADCFAWQSQARCTVPEQQRKGPAGATAAATGPVCMNCRCPAASHEDLLEWLQGLVSSQARAMELVAQQLSARPTQDDEFVDWQGVEGSLAGKSWLDYTDPDTLIGTALRMEMPAAAISCWRPVEAAVFFHTKGLFHPRRHARAPHEGAAGARGGGLAHAAGEGLVSVICPTTDERHEFHPLVYECFTRQTYEPKELVVVDTGCRPSDFLQGVAATDARVVYRFFPVPARSWTVGLKRNIACCLARGRVIAHFDDDDLYAPDYLRVMTVRLARAALVCPPELRSDAPGPGSVGGEHPPAAAVTLASWHLLDSSTGTFAFLDAEHDPEVGGRHQWLYGWGFSYVFMRRAWELCPFPELTMAEDYEFMQAILGHGVPVHLVHGGERHLSAGLCAHSFLPKLSTSGGELSSDGLRRRAVEGTPRAFRDLLPLMHDASARILAALPAEGNAPDSSVPFFC